MAGERRTVLASQFCASVRDGTHDSPKPAEHGEFLVTSRHLTGGRLDLGSAYRISKLDFDAINQRSKVDRWDVLISMIGTVGEPCLIKDEPNFAIKNIGLFKSKGEIEGKWLYYYLRSPETQQLIREHARGTTQQYIPLNALRDLPVLAPTDREEMSAIAHILGTLDDKIELNRRQNETMEAMARALFKSWFVDFDPVRAKVEGCDTGLPGHIAKFFPNSFENSMLGEIPRGWQTCKWGDLVTLEYGKSLAGYNREDGEYPVYGTNGKIGTHSVSLCPHPGIVIGRKGAYRGIHYCSAPFFVIDTAFFVAPRKPIELRWAYYELLRNDINSMDSGSAIPSTSREDFYNLPVLAPPVAVQKSFVRLLESIWIQKGQNNLESNTLANLRDTLLPQLLSGELPLPETATLLVKDS